MATFEHRKYPALTMQDENGVWAQFADEERTFGEHVVKVGVLHTDDAALADRLRACSDPHLVEIGGPGVRKTGQDAEEVPDGSIAEVLSWVGDNPDRARRALEMEQAKPAPRSTLVAQLEPLTR